MAEGPPPKPLSPVLNDPKFREALQAGSAEVLRRAEDGYRFAKKQVNQAVEQTRDWLEERQSKAAAEVKAQQEALNQPNHPLRQKVVAANAAVSRLEKVVAFRGCLCREETSVPQGPGPWVPTQLCVLRSGVTGQAKVWTSRYYSDCAKDCARWTADTGYTDLCATSSQRDAMKSDLARAKEGFEASERALSDEIAGHQRTLQRLIAWKPFKS